MSLLASLARIQSRLACAVLMVGATLAPWVPLGLADNLTEPLALHASSSELALGPYLIRSRPGEMLVVLKASLRQAPRVGWWRTSGRKHLGPVSESALHEVQAARKDGLWVATLRGLPLDRLVAYQVLTERGDSEPNFEGETFDEALIVALSPANQERRSP